MASDINGDKTAAPGRDGAGRFASGNGYGRGRPPKALSITERLREKSAEAVKDGDATNLERLAGWLWSLAVGDEDGTTKERLEAAKLLMDRTEGRPHQTLAVEQGETKSMTELADEVLRDLRELGLNPRVAEEQPMN